jgi:DNA-binding response OmpR family regulator
MVKRPTVLVADTDPGIRRLLRRHFGTAGYTVITADRGRAVLDHLRRIEPDVVILSSEMGDMDGVDFVTKVRDRTGSPLLVLIPTNHSEMHAILDAGADDCLDEPFLLEELAARTRRLLHRAGVHLGPRVFITTFGKLQINSLDRSATLGGVQFGLTRREFDLLAVLANANGRTLSYPEILTKVWGDEDDNARRNLHRVVGALRRKIEPQPDHPTYLINLRGEGYRLNLQEEPSQGI